MLVCRQAMTPVVRLHPSDGNPESFACDCIIIGHFQMALIEPSAAKNHEHPVFFQKRARRNLYTYGATDGIHHCNQLSTRLAEIFKRWLPHCYEAYNDPETIPWSARMFPQTTVNDLPAAIFPKLETGQQHPGLADFRTIRMRNRFMTDISLSIVKLKRDRPITTFRPRLFSHFSSLWSSGIHYFLVSATVSVFQFRNDLRYGRNDCERSSKNINQFQTHRFQLLNTICPYCFNSVC
jgi:hypothetical protein